MTISREPLDPAAADRPPDALHLFVLLPTLNPYGGVVSVVNLCNRLIAKGHVVTLASLSHHTTQLLHPRTEPILVDDPHNLVSTFSDRFDVILATSWQTVAPVVALANASEAVPWYFVQDYEPDFYTNPTRREEARATYDLISNKIVKTAYLENRLVLEGGWSSHRIRPGMDLDTFYPRQPVGKRDASVIAMARPGTPSDHRGFDILCAVYEAVGDLRPDIRLKVFGTSNAGHFGVPVEALGKLAPDALPFIYSDAAVFLDTSRQHGFGRTGVEAMACGTPPVLSKSGGVSDYAKDADNSLLVDVGDIPATVEAILTLIDNPDIARRLAQSGLQTVASFDDDAAADDLLRVLSGP